MLEVNPLALGHPEWDELAALLNLRPGLLRYEVVVATEILADPLLIPGPRSDELPRQPRSTAQVYYYLSNGVEVPPSTSPPGSRGRRSGRTGRRSTAGP